MNSQSNLMHASVANKSATSMLAISCTHVSFKKITGITKRIVTLLNLYALYKILLCMYVCTTETCCWYRSCC